MTEELKVALRCRKATPCEDCPKYVRCILWFVEHSEYQLNRRVKPERVVVRY